MAWLPEGEQSLKIYLFVLTECTNVTDRHTDGQTLHKDIGRAYVSHRAAKNHLNKKKINSEILTLSLVSNKYECKINKYKYLKN